MKTELTERQNTILEFIGEFVEANGFPPTYREIGKNFNITSTNGVKRHIDALVKKGFITIESNSSRAIAVTSSSDSISKSVNISEQKDTYSIPLVGRVAAGFPILAQENIEDNISIDPNMIGTKQNCFALKVRGDSMMNAGILEDDIVVVAPQSSAKNGDIIVALLGDEATMKRLITVQQRLCLMPENDNYPLIEVNNREDFSIIGKVIGVLRFYN
ncbi:MAG: transcriptional repressor LexA [Melioribacteraceae bacterium]|nr:transcriptional repressor LexA [Melioribacteraceae bacterium]